MGIPLIYSRRFDKAESDGLMPVDSAKFENYRGNYLPNSVSHSQIVDFMTPKRKKKKSIPFIWKSARNLPK